ncbi:MAG: DUF3536 domain-containing protein [Proteobacteria bacterium]|nr:DUF3536 domain-containing protein [Pseudomonadota bacterium]MCP4918039.1 DUF3536 domain-containing protein [Pseudomonadota bacterium]
MRYVCVHGHFYQPPRENPFTGRVDPQPSAAPWPDWNHRITAECYRPNTRAPLLDEHGEIRGRINTFAHTSSDVGPTLMRWLERHAPDVHEAIVEADRQAIARLGHGSAIAQGFHHAILPLASERDRLREIAWGIRDFQGRFGRDPDAMWLPETAVDLDTLDALARAGIRWTILAPRQCAEVRSPGGGWQPFDSRRPYVVNTRQGRSIVVFFYDGPTSRGVAFDGLLHDGDHFAQVLAHASCDAGLAMVATDGESYGHHHRHGEMALAKLIEVLDHAPDVLLTNPSAYLVHHPATWEARIVEPSSWSCAHGVGRWSANCGCAMDPARSGQQAWRQTLRTAMDALRDAIGERDAASPDLERARLQMYTSCGWFFDGPDGLEAVQILTYALRAITLHRELSGEDLEPLFVERLGPLDDVWQTQVRTILGG